MSRRSPNKPASGKAGIAPPLSIAHHWPGLPDPARWVHGDSSVRPLTHINAIRAIVRGVLLVTLLAGACGSGCRFAQTAREADRIRSEVDLYQLQEWAVGVLARYPDGTDGGFLDEADLPPMVRSVPSFGFMGPLVSVSQREPVENRAVSLHYLGSFEIHRLVIVGSPEYRTQTNRGCIALIPGVYFVDY